MLCPCNCEVKPYLYSSEFGAVSVSGRINEGKPNGALSLDDIQSDLSLRTAGTEGSIGSTKGALPSAFRFCALTAKDDASIGNFLPFHRAMNGGGSGSTKSTSCPGPYGCMW